MCMEPAAFEEDVQHLSYIHIYIYNINIYIYYYNIMFIIYIYMYRFIIQNQWWTNICAPIFIHADRRWCLLPIGSRFKSSCSALAVSNSMIWWAHGEFGMSISDLWLGAMPFLSPVCSKFWCWLIILFILSRLRDRDNAAHAGIESVKLGQLWEIKTRDKKME